MRYELYYWPGIQGRGEFVRLTLEAAGAEYVDVARRSSRDGLGMPAMMRLLESASAQCLPFAPPFLKAGDRIIGQTANILLFLGARHDLAPRDEAGRLWAHQLQLTVADFVVEIHDTHHPIASNLYYEDQMQEAAMRAKDFIKHRLPKFLGYFSKVLARNPHEGGHMAGSDLSHVDLSMFQLIEGLRYAFPNAMARIEPKHAGLIELHDRVAQHPPIARYLASDRRIPFNEEGIFRHYAELDA
jgi:glutathione S-transferase